MKKVLFFFIAALSLLAVSCKEKENGANIDWNKVTVDGFYVAGPATGSDEIKPECVMAAGYNEVDKAVREGMYEKYIVLEANKEFYLLYKDGDTKTQYGADLKEFTTPLEEAYSDNPEKVVKGKMIAGDNAPVMKVTKTGLYHIVLDINKAGDLKEPQILLLDASDFGVRGGMNGWGFTSADPKVTEFSNAGITFNFKDQELGAGGEFKFATGNYWKVTLDDAGKVKAEVSLAAGMTINGSNIKVEKGGKYDLALNFKLAQGAFDKSFSYTATCTEESTAPETMYMIGAQWGNWTWTDPGVVDLVPVWGAPGYFWVTRYFEANGEFKFCAVKDWNGDFGDNGNNIKIENAGFYTILVNGNENKYEIMPAEVYVIGLTGTVKTEEQDVWDFNGADVLKFTAEDKVLTATLANAGELRLASKVTPSAAIAGVTTANGWIDWWKTEFIFFDGKIAYRGAGNDQERVQGAAGQKLTLDFNAGTVTVEAGEAPFVSPIKIDGVATDWEGVENVNSLVLPEGATQTALKSAKILYAEKLYLLVELSDEAIADGKVRLHVYFDTDETGQAQQAWNKADIDYMTEGKITDTGKGFVSYSSGLYPWAGTTPGEWKWGDATSAFTYESAGADNLYELAIDYTNYPGGLPEQFNIAIDVVFSDWSVHGYLPQTANKLVIKKDGIAEQPAEPEPQADGIVLDGKFDDWKDIEAVPGKTGGSVIEWKASSDEDNIYFYFKIDSGDIIAAKEEDPAGSGKFPFNWRRYMYIGLDLDGNAETPDATTTPGKDLTITGCEATAITYPFRGNATSAGGTDGAEVVNGVDSQSEIKLNGTKQEGKLSAWGVIEGEYGYLEVSLPRAALGSPAAGTINVQFSYSYNITNIGSFVIE